MRNKETKTDFNLNNVYFKNKLERNLKKMLEPSPAKEEDCRLHKMLGIEYL